MHVSGQHKLTSGVSSQGMCSARRVEQFIIQAPRGHAVSSQRSMESCQSELKALGTAHSLSRRVCGRARTGRIVSARLLFEEADHSPRKHPASDKPRNTEDVDQLCMEGVCSFL